MKKWLKMILKFIPVGEIAEFLLGELKDLVHKSETKIDDWSLAIIWWGLHGIGLVEEPPSDIVRDNGSRLPKAAIKPEYLDKVKTTDNGFVQL